MRCAVRPYCFFFTMALGLTACTNRPEPASPPIALAQPVPLPPKKPVRTAKPKPVEPPKPITVVGKREEDVVALLGAPLNEEAAPPAKILRFSANGCGLEVYVFPDMAQGGGFRALDMRATGGPTAPQCLERIRAEQAE